jgi:hypothetical protein
VSKNNRKPGFTYVETLVSVMCILIFIIGYQNFNTHCFKQRNNLKIRDELQNVSSFISKEMQIFNNEQLIVDSFKGNGSEYWHLTNDQQIQLPKTLEDANVVYSLDLPDEYLDGNYKIMLSRSGVNEFGLYYYLYHVVVFTKEEKTKAHSSFQKRCYP